MALIFFDMLGFTEDVSAKPIRCESAMQIRLVQFLIKKSLEMAAFLKKKKKAIAR